MKTSPHKPLTIGNPAFTLVEMIGVIAIMGILAATLAPNALRLLERAAVRAEAATLHNLGEQVKLSFIGNGWAPGLKPVSFPAIAPTWDQDLGTFADISPTDILTNKRLMPRVYVLEPVVSPAVPTRAMLLSSMRASVALPTTATISANFSAIWDTPDNSVPVAAGWGAWNTSNIEFLVIERVSLQAIYMTVALSNNSPTTTVSYAIVSASGTAQTAQNLAAKAKITLTMRPKEQLRLYNTAGGGPVPDYTYMVSSGYKVIDFNDTKFWIPQ